MPQPDPSTKRSPLALCWRVYFWLILAGWTLTVSASLVWTLADRNRAIEGVAIQVARSLFEKDLLFRAWATQHGGVYVPVTAHTQPNPYLKVPERDITTPSGRPLTLMNPAFMSRQVFELQDKELGIRSHITSLKPIRPENRPDEWERKALERFESGQKEATAFLKDKQGMQIRLMRPVITTEGCLRCHADQGYRVGDVRGGISVSAPMSLFTTPGRVRNLILAHVGLWLLGCILLVIEGRKLREEIRLRELAAAERERVIEELHGALITVKTLRGLVPICASCKKIRDDQGFWHQVEEYVQNNSEATFSHGVCPDCAQKWYRELDQLKKDG